MGHIFIWGDNVWENNQILCSTLFTTLKTALWFSLHVLNRCIMIFQFGRGEGNFNLNVAIYEWTYKFVLIHSRP